MRQEHQEVINRNVGEFGIGGDIDDCNQNQNTQQQLQQQQQKQQGFWMNLFPQPKTGCDGGTAGGLFQACQNSPTFTSAYPGAATTKSIAVNSADRINIARRNIDIVLAKELNQLSPSERDHINEDIHCLPDHINETSELIDSSLRQLDIELNAIRHKNAYNLAKSLDNNYVNDPKLRLAFIRADSYDSKMAANRMVQFFENKFNYFGADKLTRTITLNDLDDDSLLALKSGMIQVFPKKDRAGRTVFCIIPQNRIHKEADSTCRAFFVILQSLWANEDIQKAGVIGIFYHVSIGVHFKPVVVRRVAGLRQSCPLRYVCSHICFRDPIFSPTISLAIRFLRSYGRVRLRVHPGSETECSYSLMTFGIPKECLPQKSSDDKYAIDGHKKWLQQNFDIKSLSILDKIDLNTNSSTMRSPVITNPTPPRGFTSIPFFDKMNINTETTAVSAANENENENENQQQQQLSVMDANNGDGSGHKKSSPFSLAPLQQQYDNTELSTTTDLSSCVDGGVGNTGGSDIKQVLLMSQKFKMVNLQTQQQQQLDNLTWNQLSTDTQTTLIAINEMTRDVEKQVTNLQSQNHHHQQQQQQQHSNQLPSTTSNSASAIGVVAPQINDILFGRGRPLQLHPANIKYRKLIDTHKPSYENARRCDKPKISAMIVRVILGSSGRFLKQATNNNGGTVWIEVDDEEARRKVSHDFRNRRI